MRAAIAQAIREAVEDEKARAGHDCYNHVNDAVAEEREACAKIAERFRFLSPSGLLIDPTPLATAIRGRE
jgi:hypothetical protein